MANYYVATTGSDSAAGTEGAPWLTLQYAVNNTSAGDTVYIRGGTYSGSSFITFDNDGGAAGNYKVFTNYAGEDVVISHTLLFFITQYVKFLGNSTGELKFTKTIYLHTRVTDPATSRNKYIHFKDFVWYGDSGGDSAAISIHGDNVTIENGNITDLADVSTGNHCIYPTSGDGITIRGNTINQCSDWGIHAYSQARAFQPSGYDNSLTNLTIEKNKILNSQARGGILIGGADPSYGVSSVTVKNNVIYDQTGGASNAHGIYIRSYTSLGVTGVNIYNNTFYNLAAAGIYLRGSATDNVNIKNNLFYEITSYDIHKYETMGIITADYNFYDPSPNNSQVTDSNAQSGTTNFENQVTKDFRLKSTSNAINVGTTLSDVPDDILGTVRPQGAGYDCGAYEAQATDFTSDPNCVALWKFESGALTTDSQGTNTLTSGGSPVADTSDYREGSASVDLESADGDEFYITDVNLDSGFPLKSGEANSTFSICLWYKPESFNATGRRTYFSKYDGGSNKRSFALHDYNGSVVVYIGHTAGASAETVSAGYSLSVDRWYHIAFTFDDSDRSYKFRIWDDTAQSVVCTTSGTAANNIAITDATVYIGDTVDSGVNADGKVDQVVVFSDVLTTDEIDNIRAGAFFGDTFSVDSTEYSIVGFSATLRKNTFAVEATAITVTGSMASLAGIFGNYTTKLTDINRQPQTIIVINADYCDLTYGVAPCTASGAAGSECYNTRKTCQDPTNYTNTLGKNYKFCLKDAPLPIVGKEIRPYLLSESYTPTKIDSTESLTRNATIKLEFAEEPDNDIGVDPYVANRSSVQGTFWRKWFARNYHLGRTVTIKKGFVGLQEAAYRNRKFIIEEIRGPNDGVVEIIAKDLLKLANIVTVPKATDGLVTSNPLSSDSTIIGCDKTGEYPSTGGVVRIGDELIKYSTLNSTALFLGSTGQRGYSIGNIVTSAEEHAQESKIQLCYTATSQNVYNIIEDILVNQIGISTVDIDQSGSTTERDLWLNAFTFTGVISNPITGSDVLQELQQQSLTNLWWSDEDQKVKFKAFAPNLPNTTVTELNDTANIVEVESDNNDQSRLSRVLVYFNKKKLDDDEKPASYLSNTLSVSTDAESSSQYGQQAPKTIYSRWITSETVANTIAKRLLNRFRDPAKKLNISLELKDSGIKTADIVNITSTAFVNETGAQVSSRPFQVNSKEQKTEGLFEYELLDTGMGHKMGFIAPAGYPDYSSATEVQKQYAFIGDANNFLGGGKDEGYYIF